MTKPILTQEYLKEALHYDPETGIFTWKVRPLKHFVNTHRMNLINSKCEGKVAGHMTDQGYLTIGLKGTGYKAHRLAFIYMTGECPAYTDHINHIRTDNRWVNLREATIAENNRNLSLRKTSLSGVPGVSWHKETKKWRARIFKEYLGVFDNLDEAIAARLTAAKNRGFHENHGAKNA